MALFGGGYDNRYTNNWSDRSHWGRSDRPLEPRSSRGYGRAPYGSDYETGPAAGGWGAGDHTGGYGQDYQWGRFDRGNDRGYYGAGYDRGFKSREQTDYGDPFHDREQHTPVRVIRGRPHFQDEGFRDRNFGGTSYDRSYESRGYPWGYQPYARRTGYDGGFDRGPYRGHRSSGYDRGYF
ncbi:MAG: hypothetical protein WD737_06860 [Gemmatimonadota bacterium]